MKLELKHIYSFEMIPYQQPWWKRIFGNELQVFRYELTIRFDQQLNVGDLVIVRIHGPESVQIHQMKVSRLFYKSIKLISTNVDPNKYTFNQFRNADYGVVESGLIKSRGRY